MDVGISIDGHVRLAPDRAEDPKGFLSLGLFGDFSVGGFDRQGDRIRLLLGPGHAAKVPNHRNPLLHCPRIGRVNANPHCLQGPDILAAILLHVGEDQVRLKGLNLFEIWIFLSADLGLGSNARRWLGAVAGHTDQTLVKAQYEEGLGDTRNEGDDPGRESGKTHAPPRRIYDFVGHQPKPLPRSRHLAGGLDRPGRDRGFIYRNCRRRRGLSGQRMWSEKYP